jgi:hypothetical protein
MKLPIVEEAELQKKVDLKIKVFNFCFKKIFEVVPAYLENCKEKKTF